LPFARRVAEIGMHNSLAQLTLKIASPGVPDFYQGTELWDFSLVDPDNRRPVDFALRRKLLDELRTSALPRAELARELYARWEDGRIKLLLTQAGLEARRSHGELFAGGGYAPLETEGLRAANLCAFARNGPGGQLVIAVVPRLVADLVRGARLPPEAFAGTTVEVPAHGRLRDVFTREERHVHDGRLRVDELFSTLPVALLIRE